MKFPPKLRLTALFAGLALASPQVAVAAEGAPAAGATDVLKWADGKQACFLLAFDDSAPSQLKNVVPELEKRQLTGTFYLVTGNSLYAHLKAQWEAAARSPAVVVANHTFTHRGVNNAEELEPELAKCNEVLYALHPEQKQPRLLAFGKPGGVPWIVPKESFQAALERHHLVDRPPFGGPPINYKSAEAAIAVIDQALAKGEMGHLDFHGVGGDWLVTPVEWFAAILDKLVASREQLWITDAASWHKYVREREGAAIKLVESEPKQIKLELTTPLDPVLYDLPLTLRTRTPAAWRRCSIVQGGLRNEAPVRDGAVQYTAVPGGGAIILQPIGAESSL